MAELVTAVAITTGLALFFAIVLTVAYRFLRVEEDPRREVVENLLPGNNCGACGQPGCAAFAEKLLAGEAAPGQCTVADPDTREQIASFLGVGVGEQERRIARLRCAGGQGNVRDLAEYRGLHSCRAAAVVDGGAQSCSYGCLGLADCERACTFDAIRMNEDALPVVNPELCTACGDCVDVCPRDLFVLVAESQRLFVQCASPLSGEAALRSCRVACDACGRCAADAPDVIQMVGGLPQIQLERLEHQSAKATWRCPTGAITWLEGEQFGGSLEDEDAPPWRSYG